MNFGGRYYREQLAALQKLEKRRVQRILRPLLALCLLGCTALSIWSLLPRTDGLVSPTRIGTRSFFITPHEKNELFLPTFAVWEKFEAISPQPVFGYTRSINLHVPPLYKDKLVPVGNLQLDSLTTKTTVDADEPIPLPITINGETERAEIKVAFELPAAGSNTTPSYKYGSVWSQLPRIKDHPLALAFILIDAEKVSTDSIKVTINEAEPVLERHIQESYVLLNGAISACDAASEFFTCQRTPGKQTVIQLNNALWPGNVFGIGVALSDPIVTVGADKSTIKVTSSSPPDANASSSVGAHEVKALNPSGR